MSELASISARAPSATGETSLAGGGPAAALASDTSFCPSCGKIGKGAICPVDGQVAIRLTPPMAGATQVQAGQVLAGKYRIIEEIGHGGHGVVYRAEHLFGLGPVALKLLRHEDPDIEELRRFFREAQVTARLRSPYTATLFDVGQAESGVLYMAMELVEGCTLEQWLRQLEHSGEVLGETVALRIGAAILAGLADIHAVGLVHRDLKPANIAVSANLKVIKILDFGLARVIGSSLTPMASALGTPQYMSPEQCSGQVVDLRADLYSVGIILYRCVTGSTPFRHADPLTAMWSHLHTPIPDLASNAPQPLSAQFRAVVHRALAKEPSRRFATAAQMAAALAGQEPQTGWVAESQIAARMPLQSEVAETTVSQLAVQVVASQPHRATSAAALRGWKAGSTVLAAATAAIWLFGSGPPAHAPAVAHRVDPVVQPAVAPAPLSVAAPHVRTHVSAVPVGQQFASHVQAGEPLQAAVAPPPATRAAAKQRRPPVAPRAKSKDPRLSQLP